MEESREENIKVEDSDVKTEVHTVLLQNIPMGNDHNMPVVLSSFVQSNSDGNLQINSEDHVVHAYILDDGDVSSTISEGSIQISGYIEHSRNSSTANLEVEDYMEEVIDEDDLTSLSDDADDPDMKPLEIDEANVPPQAEFDCNLCSKIFKTSIGLKRHVKTAHSTDEVESDPLTFQLCPCCGEPSDSAHTLGDYECAICTKLFLQQKMLERHTSLEHPSCDIYKCVECVAEFPEKSELIAHMRSHNFKVAKCPDCKKEFTRKYHLERHIQLTDCSRVKREELKCEVCDKIFYRKDNLKVHLRAHAGEIRKKHLFLCMYCKKEFPGHALLNIHIRTHTGEKPFSCDLCPKKFPSSGAMKKHRRMHTGEKPYQCAHCDNRFAAKETLNRHIRTHTGDKPHTCQFCGKSFIQAAQLRAHIFHHTGENAYICPYCTRAFNRKLRLTTHIKYMHEGAAPLKCPQCDKTFFRKEDLARHAISHTGERPFQCDQCDKAFAVKSSLKIHQLTHRKEPPCSCEYCGRAFIRQDCLMRHMRARHRDILEDIMISAEKKRLQQQLLTAVSEAAEKGQNSIVDTVIWNELTLTESIKELLTLLVDEECLVELGHPDAPIDKVLDAVIKRCGHTPASEEDFDYIGRMRENAKLLFTAVIDDDAVKSLLNNQTVEEVIMHVLRLAKNP